jgi:hypothetical protein
LALALRHDGISRSWNANQSMYLKAIAIDNCQTKLRHFLQSDASTEYIMTGLLLIWGVSISQLEFGSMFPDYLMKQIKFPKDRCLKLKKRYFETYKKRKSFFGSGIANDLCPKLADLVCK